MARLTALRRARGWTRCALIAALIPASAVPAGATPDATDAASWSAPAFLRSYGSSNRAFVYPWGLSVNALTSEVIVSDQFNGKVRRYDFDGRHLGDLPTQPAVLATVATDPTNGDIYVFDDAARREHKGLLRYDRNGAFLNRIELGNNATPFFDVDTDGMVWIAVGPRQLRYQVQQYRSDGTRVGSVPLVNTAPRTIDLRGLAVASDGRIFVADARNRLIHVFAPDGTTLTTFGSDVLGRKLFGLALDEASGLLYTSDLEWNVVRKLRLDGTPLADVGEPGTGDGQFRGPRQLDVDPATGDLYVIDLDNERYQRFSRDGAFLRVLPSSPHPAYTTGGLAFPRDIAVDPHTDDVYVADVLNQQIIEFREDGTPEASFGHQWPFVLEEASAIGVDDVNRRLWVARGSRKINVYDLDDLRASPRTVRVGPSPSDITFFDGEAYVLDAEGRTIHVFDAALLAPVRTLAAPLGATGIAFNPENGDRYIVVNTGHALRWYSPEGTIVRGLGAPGDAPGQFRSAQDVAIVDGILYITDDVTHRISVWTTDGDYLGRFGGEGDGPHQFRRPTSLATAGGRLYVTDVGNGRVSVFDTTTPKPPYVYERPRIRMRDLPAEVPSASPILVHGTASGGSQPIANVEWSLRRDSTGLWWNDRTMSWEPERVGNLGRWSAAAVPATDVSYVDEIIGLPADEAYRVVVLARNVHGTPSRVRVDTVHVVA